MPRLRNRNLRIYLVLILDVTLWCSLGTHPTLAGDVLSTDGPTFLLDGKPFDMWGVRVATALWDNATVQACIDALPQYLDHGINTIYVSLQGSHPGFEIDPQTGLYVDMSSFNPDGSLRPEYTSRLQQLLVAARDLDMVVNVGYFYQMQCRTANLDLNLYYDHWDSEEAIFTAIRNATGWLAPYRHVFVDIVNEFGHHGYDYDDVFPDFHVTPENVMREKAQLLVDILHEVDPDRLCGVSPCSNRGILGIPGADVAYTHGSPHGHLSGDRPQVNNESYYSPDIVRRDGVYDASVKEMIQQDAVQEHENGNYWFWHSGWMQILPFHFEPTGGGTEENPGDGWMFDFLHEHRFDVQLTDLSATVSQSEVHLSWRANTLLENVHFNVFRCPRPLFSLGEAQVVKVGDRVSDQNPATDEIDWADPAEGYLGVVSQNAFYAITATHGGLETPLLGYACELDFALTTTNGTDFNAVCYPFTSTTAGSASQLQGVLGQCNSVARWDASSGAFHQYVASLPNTDFQIETHRTYFVNVTSPAVLTTGGTIEDQQYHLTASPEGTLNEIVLPFGKADLTTAAHLLADIPSCTKIAQWDAAQQQFAVYEPSLPASDFSLVPGWPYFVEVSVDVDWPQ